MKKIQIVNISRIMSMLAFTAVTADLFYIIHRMCRPVLTADDLSFICAVPDMLRLMLLSTAIVSGFLALTSCILKEHE